MKKLFEIIILLCAICFSSSIYASDIEKVISNFESEVVDCAAYFFIGMGAMQRAQNEDGERKMELQYGMAYSLAKWLSGQDETILKPRFELYQKSQLEKMKYDYSNLSVLIAKYKDICSQLIWDPKERIRYWGSIY